MRRWRGFTIFILPVFAWLHGEEAHATRIHERLMLGGYAASERFTDTTGESVSNDYEILSARAYIKVEDWGAGKYEFISDIRDKNDFFGALDGTKLQLVNSNELQARQFSLRKPNLGESWAWEIGRFPVLEAGATYVDGAFIENRWTRDTRTGVFAGLNPRQASRPYLEFTPNAQTAGLSLTYENHSLAWDRNFYLSHAIVTEVYDGHTDRTYLFHNAIYQWAMGRRLITFLYLDFVPNVYVQTGSLNWQQQLSPKFSNELDLLGVDVIEYRRRQGILETLTPSPYKEASEQISYLPDELSKYYLRVTYGQRQVDGLTKTELDLGWTRTNLFSRNWDGYAMVGERQNFVSQDQLVRFGLGYFSRAWESNLDVNYGIENYTTGQTLHPLVTELSLSNYFSNKFYTTLSFEYAVNEAVTVMAGFFRLGVRLGNEEVAPIRDGAPPRGSL